MTTSTSKMLMVPDGRMVTVRSAVESDAHGLIAHTQAVLSDGTGMCMTRDEFAVSAESEAQWIRDHERDPKQLLLVAEFDGLIIGMLDFHPLPRRMLDHVGEFGMSIHLDWRGQGIGRFLLDGLLGWARGVEGLRKITLSVRADNAPAIAIYEMSGFKEEGRRVGQIRLRDGGIVDELLMYRMIATD